MKALTAAIVTLGCRLNQADSALLTGRLRRMNIEPVPYTPAGADIILINSCAVTATAARKSRQTVRQFRLRHPDAILILTGCAADVDRTAVDAIDGIDLILTNEGKKELETHDHNLDFNIYRLLKDIIEGKRIVDITLNNFWTLEQTSTYLAFCIKNELVNIIQRHNGVDSSTIDEIAGHLSDVNYRSVGRCDESEDGIGYTISGGRNQTKANYCIKCVNINVNLNDPYKQFPNASYYKVKVFFSLDLPIVNDIFNFNLSGTTKTLYYPVNGGSCSV